MNELEIRHRLIKDARQGGICPDGLREMRRRALDDLVDYYIENPDWCMERGFPDLQTLSDSFMKCESKGVYVNKAFDGEVFSRLQVYVFHNCSGHINVVMDYDRAIIPMLYFANHCNITIGCSQKNTPAIVVPVYATDERDNVVNLEESEGCRFVRHAIKLIES